MMEVTTTAVLNLTFLMTLGIGFLMFLGHTFMFATVLMLAGAARLIVLTFTALWNRPSGFLTPWPLGPWAPGPLAQRYPQFVGGTSVACGVALERIGPLLPPAVVAMCLT
jgi:hypothetical protein